MTALGERGGVAALALRLLVLTAVRSMELRGARWAEIDREAAVWIIAGERMKGGRDHRVPLTPEALAILETVRGLDRDLVFPGRKWGRPMGGSTLAAVLERAGYGEYTIHGFRSAFRDWAAESTTFPREIAELSLAHEVGNAVERSYRRSDLIQKRRDLMSQWAIFCLSASAAGDVVEVRR